MKYRNMKPFIGWDVLYYKKNYQFVHKREGVN